ncbi:MAG: tyrosine-type recombinase/integrase [Bdellovibrionales bacterium]|nr:tyrosine-type recombinase/integrase [Bdellovibrionales bacterium]
MSEELKSFLKEYKLARGGNGYVFPRLSGWHSGKAAEILRVFQKENGIRATNFHSIRATFITQLLLAGVAVTKVQKLVGHKDLKTTMDYVRLIASDLDGSTDALSLKNNHDGAKVIQFNRPS